MGENKTRNFKMLKRHANALLIKFLLKTWASSFNKKTSLSLNTEVADLLVMLSSTAESFRLKLIQMKRASDGNSKLYSFLSKYLYEPNLEGHPKERSISHAT